MSTRPSSVDELESAAEDDRYLQPYGPRLNPSDAHAVFHDCIRAGRKLMTKNSDAIIQSRYEDDAADLERAYIKYRTGVLVANRYLLSKNKYTGDPDARRSWTAKVEELVKDLETFAGIINSRYAAYSQRPPIPGAVPRYQVKRHSFNFFRKSNPRLASHLAPGGSRPESILTSDPVTGDAQSSVGNIVSLISTWERRSLLVAQGADPRTLSENDADIISCLTLIIQSSDARRAVLDLQPREAQPVLEAIHDALGRGLSADPSYENKARRLMFKLSEARDILPASLFIDGVSNRTEHPLHAGGYGDVYQASHKGKLVALKRIRMFTSEVSKEQRSKFCREALLWQGLSHQCIHPFYGIDQHSFATTYCMVSPWMEHGTVLRYLAEHERSRGVLNRFLLQIAQGIHYLHSKSVIHGDIRGANILIAPSSNENSTSSSSSSLNVHACLTDFGLAKVVMGEGETATGLASSSNIAGSLRWFAPELLSPQAFGCEKFARTRATDVYAFACVCVELYTLSPPFANAIDPAVILKVINGERPERPVGMPDGIWQVATKGWAPKWMDRPGTEDIIRRLENELAL